MRADADSDGQNYNGKQSPDQCAARQYSTQPNPYGSVLGKQIDEVVGLHVKYST
jgi:hypothetical protein